MLNVPVTFLISIAIAYLIGSIPFGFLTGKIAGGIDIREHGSKNIGATNVTRVLGKRLGLLVLLLDCLKGLLSTSLLVDAVSSFEGAIQPEWLHLRIACGIAAIIGHMFPCWLRFRGGKGVATALGVAIILSWQATLAATVVFAIVFAVSRIVSLSSMLSTVSFAAVHFWLTAAAFSTENWSLSAFSLAAPLLIVVRHRSNIIRLFRGKESKFGAAKDADPRDDASVG